MIINLLNYKDKSFPHKLSKLYVPIIIRIINNYYTNTSTLNIHFDIKNTNQCILRILIYFILSYFPENSFYNDQH